MTPNFEDSKQFYKAVSGARSFSLVIFFGLMLEHRGHLDEYFWLLLGLLVVIGITSTVGDIFVRRLQKGKQTVLKNSTVVLSRLLTGHPSSDSAPSEP